MEYLEGLMYIVAIICFIWYWKIRNEKVSLSKKGLLLFFGIILVIIGHLIK